MKFPYYSQYKKSGVEWIGSVPAHWKVSRIGNLFRESSDEGEEGLPILSVSIHDGVSDKELSEDELDRKVTRSDDISKYKKVRSGDLVYNMMRAWQGGFGTVSVDGLVSPAYVVARPANEFHTRFVEQVLRTPSAIEEMRRHSRGVTDFRLRLYWDEFKSMRVAIPDAIEQSTILSFLDRETSKIDALVAEQEKLVELLNEKRHAAVCHAVTKGFDLAAPMRDSGIEWLGSIPKHWTVAALNYRYDVALGKMLDEKRFSGSHAGPYLRNVDVQWGSINTEDLPLMDFPDAETARYGLTIGDLLVCEGGEIGRAAIWRGDLDRCFYQKALHRIRARNEERDSTEFLYFVFFAFAKLSVFSGSEGKSTISHLTAETLRRYRFAFPPIEEQLAITDYLNARSAEVGELVNEARRSIELLKEHRSALISAAVAGKIDVRSLMEAGPAARELEPA